MFVEHILYDVFKQLIKLRCIWLDSLTSAACLKSILNNQKIIFRRHVIDMVF